MSYELGQRAALEKLAVFSEYLKTLPAARLLPVRGQNLTAATFGGTAADAMKNIKNKYMRKAPQASQALIDSLTTAQRTSGTAPVKRLVIGHGGGAHGGYFDADRAQVGVNYHHHEGTLLHELGHALPGGLSGTLPEEARATQHAINNLGPGHPEVTDLLRSFGTYVQNRTPGAPRLPVAEPPARLTGLVNKYTPETAADWTPAFDAWKKRELRRDEPKYTAINKEKELALASLDESKRRLTKKLRDHPSDTILSKLDHLFDTRRGRVREHAKRQESAVNREYYNRSNSALSRIEGMQARLRQLVPSEPTLADYAKLQGTEREQLDNWIAGMRDTIDSHFWEGAGSTALEPILAEIERLRR
jgi:hypothetical protein